MIFSVPWGRTIPFDVFKEYVLPYKVRQEALVPGWRITLYNKYKHVVQGIADPKEAFATLLNYLKEHTRETNFNFSGDVDPLTMDHVRMGACSHLSVYYVAVLRALGLPAAYEYIDRWGNFSVNGQKKEIRRPFYIDYDNKIVCLVPHLSDVDTLILRRKYPLFGHWSAMWRQMKGVKIQVSDTEDFRNPTNIHTIKETPMGLLSFEAKPAIMARYVRYICPPESRTAVAEFKFFDEQDEEISIAEAMGYGIKDTVSLAFDKNGLTSVSTKAGEAWIGARLDGAAKRIARVEILPKNDGNFIDAGDRYHLYYFDSEWISLGEQVATSNLLTYKNVPRGALFLLKNLSKGREERVFTMEEGRQVWW